MKPQHQGLLLSFLVVAIYVWMARCFMPFPANFEDSYIMYRYVQNGAEGFLYEWNRDAGTVQGTTGIAWVTLLTLFTRLTRFDVIDVNSYAGLIFSILTLLVVYATAARHFIARNWWLAVCPLIVIGSSAFFIRSSGNGLETSITVFIVAISIYLLQISRTSASSALGLGVFSGLTVLVRPDLTLFPLALFFFAFVLAPAGNPQKIKHCAVLIGCAVLSAIVTLYVVSRLTGTALPLAAGVKFALVDLLLGRLPESQYRFILSCQFGFLSFLLPLIFLAVISSAFLEWNVSKKYMPIYFACAVFYLYQFSVLPIVNVAYRFQLPLLIGMSFSIVHFFEFSTRHASRHAHSVVLTVAIALLLALGNVGGLFTGKKEAEFYRTDHTPYEQIGRELRGINGVVIASPEAGKLAYYSDRKFFDTIGLNDRFVAENKKKGNYPALLLDYLKSDFGMPDIYVRPTQAQIENYSYLEIIPGFDKMYECNTARNAERTGMVVCVYKLGGRAAAVHAALDRTDIGVEFH
jgi:hypothetical protein